MAIMNVPISILGFKSSSLDHINTVRWGNFGRFSDVFVSSNESDSDIREIFSKFFQMDSLDYGIVKFLYFEIFSVGG